MCEMRTACLEYALANDERFGVWGGLSEKERLSLRRTQDQQQHQQQY
jgi:WhiB family redox-sensing transcriptional regulator